MIKILKSRTIWTLAAMFVIGGLNALVPVVPAGLQTFIVFLLAVLASYFHINPTTTYNLPTDGSAIKNPIG